MKEKIIYSSERTEWISILERSRLIWPFFSSHSEARLAMEEGICQQQVYLIYDQGRPVLFIQVEDLSQQWCCEITNLLMVEFLSQKRVLQLLELFTRKFLKRQMKLDFSNTVFSLAADFFLENGFVQKSKNFEKVINYRLALVLGGGGSHGAYQIGVWQALLELDISVQIITGTSVGALNGALMMQGDLDEAKNLWQELSTEQVLNFPAAAEKPDNLPSLMGQIASLTSHALANRGVSTEPLRKIMEELISFEKMDCSKISFSFVTTRIRGMKEMVVTDTLEFRKDWLSWLMASASFFPAMEPQKIGNEFYIDGGYRNNIPIDVAVKQGATDCLVVDVKGPGIIKPVKIPAAVNLIPIHSPWSLGSFLLFTPKRSQMNLSLGYLETLKALKRLKGYWYSFPVQADLESDWQNFYKGFSAQINKKIEKNLLFPREILKKLRNFYSDRVAWEKCGQIFLELAAKTVGIEPDTVYTYAELKERIRSVLLEGRPDGLNELSVTEWLDKYYQENAPQSEFRQMKKVYEVFREAPAEDYHEEQKNLYRKLPVQSLLAAFMLYIERGK